MARFSMPDGSYPINTCADVSDAAKLAHNSKTYSFAEIRAHVMKAKAALKCPDSVLPDTWDQQNSRQPSERLTYAASSKVEGRTLSGVVHVYGMVTNDARKHAFAPGAFAKSIAAGKVKSFAWHSDSTVSLLGSQKAGTLRLTDGKELGFSLDLPDTSAGNDLRALAERGEDIGMSFQVIPKGKPQRSGGVATFADVDLVSVDPVAMPAFEGTSIELHSLQADSESVSSQVTKIRARIRARM